MKNIAKITILVIFLLVSGNLSCARNNIMKKIDISIAAKNAVNNFKGPVPVNITIKNNNNKTIYLFLNYRGFDYHIELKSKNTESVSVRKKYFYPSIEESPVPIEKESSYNFVIYLNKLVEFKKPGEANIEYDIDFALSGDQNAYPGAEEFIKKQGTLKIVTKVVDDKTLDLNLSEIAKGIESSDMQKQSEASQALCYLETPLAIKYIVKLLNTDCDTEAKAALHRLKIPESEINKHMKR